MFDEYVTAIALLSVTLPAKGADVGAAAKFVVDIAEIATSKPAALRSCPTVRAFVNEFPGHFTSLQMRNSLRTRAE